MVQKNTAPWLLATARMLVCEDACVCGRPDVAGFAEDGDGSLLQRRVDGIVGDILGRRRRKRMRKRKRKRKREWDVCVWIGWMDGCVSLFIARRYVRDGQDGN